MSSIEQLLQRSDIWQAKQLRYKREHTGISTGFPTLDNMLPQGGWPSSSLIEIIFNQPGCGELSLLLPSLAGLSQHDRWLVLINPPFIPYAPALANAGINLARLLVIRSSTPNDGLWAAEQALRSQACSAVLGWTQNIHANHIRRLQLAAESGRCLAFFFLSDGVASFQTMAPLRVQVTGNGGQFSIKILKCRGGFAPQAEIDIERPQSAQPMQWLQAYRRRQLSVAQAPSGRRIYQGEPLLSWGCPTQSLLPFMEVMPVGLPANLGDEQITTNKESHALNHEDERNPAAKRAS